MLIDADNKPWISSKIDKLIGLNKFGVLDKRKQFNEQEVKQLKQYAEQNPNTWQIRFVKRRKGNKNLKENLPKCHKSQTLIKKTSSSVNKLRGIKGKYFLNLMHTQFWNLLN